MAELAPPLVKICDGDFKIIQALSLNRSGYIAAVASVDGDIGITKEAVRLVYVADLNADGRVDGGDVTVLLGVWNTSDCIAELSGNSNVDGADMTSLLGNWSGSAPAVVGSICVAGCGVVFGDEPESLVGGDEWSEEAAAAWFEGHVHAVGFESADAFAEWGVTASPSQLDLMLFMIRGSTE